MRNFLSCLRVGGCEVAIKAKRSAFSHQVSDLPCLRLTIKDC